MVKFTNNDIFLARFHGELMPDKYVKIPDGMHLIIPYCCGQIHYELDANYEPHNEVSFVINEWINSGDNTFDVRFPTSQHTKTYMIARPGSTVCDNKLSISIEPHMGTGLYVKDEFYSYETQKQTMFVRLPIVFEECNKCIFDYDIPEDIDKLQQQITQNEQLHIPASDPSKYTDYNDMVKSIMMQVHQSMGPAVEWTYVQIINNLYKPIYEKLPEYNEGSIKKSLFNLIVNLSWKDYQNHMQKTEINYDPGFKDEHFLFIVDMAKFMSHMVFNKYYLAKAPRIEINLYTDFFKNWDGLTYKQLYLSDVIRFISNQNPNKDVLIINNSCQGFDRKDDICHTSKCMHMHRNISRNKPSTTMSFRYNTSSDTKWCTALNFIKVNGSDKYKQFYKINSMLQTVVDQMQPSLEFFGACMVNYIHVFVNYLHKYDIKMFEYFKSFTLTSKKQALELTLKPFVYSVFNTFIEKAYAELDTDSKKKRLDEIMLAENEDQKTPPFLIF
jgi:hypothetical protein